MAIEAYRNSVDEKNYFLNRQDMTLKLISMFVSPELQYHVEEESLSTPDELWTRLEVLFRNKENWEDCMQKIDKIELAENPPEDQASQFEESSTHVSTKSSFPFIQDDVYSISDLFSRSQVEHIVYVSWELHVDTFVWAMHASQQPHVETPMHASQESHTNTSAYAMHASQELHVDTFTCAMHASQEPHVETPIHASQEPHKETYACSMRASQDPKRGFHIIMMSTSSTNIRCKILTTLETFTPVKFPNS
jgi:hypothetical protein